MGILLGSSSDYCCERACVGLCERDRKGQRESRTGGKEAARQPRLSASVNVLTAHLNISLCHELFVSANMCLFACVCVCAEGAAGAKKKKKKGSFYWGTLSVPVHKVTSCCLPICLVTPP